MHDVFWSLKVALIKANSVDPYEMQHFAAFHLGPYCLQVGVTGSIQRVYHISSIIGICKVYSDLGHSLGLCT